MANGSASPTTDCIASVVSLGVHVIGRKRQVDCDGQKAGSKDALIGPLGGPSSYRPLSGRYLISEQGGLNERLPEPIPHPMGLQDADCASCVHAEVPTEEDIRYGSAATRRDIP